LEIVVVDGLQLLDRHISAQPMLELLWLQQHRHAVMHLSNEIVRLGNNHRAGLETITDFPIPPLVPQTRDRKQRRTVTRGKIPGLLAIRSVLPLVVA
jgi:hypothetical protein